MARAKAHMDRNYALHKFVKLRKRSILTRSNRLRLRYTALCSLLVLGGASALLFPDYSSSYKTQPDQEAQSLPETAQAPEFIDAPAEEAQLQVAGLGKQISGGIRRASEMIIKPEKPPFRVLKIGEGDTLSGVLESAGISGSDVYSAIAAMSEYYDPRQIKPGQTLKVDFKVEESDDPENPIRVFEKLSVKISPIQEVIVAKSGEKDFSAEMREEELVKRSYAINIKIETSLYGSALKAGIPEQVVAEMIRLYSWNVDFQRDIRQGDKIEILYETMENEDGSFSRQGNILFANLAVGGRETPIYRYEMQDGTIDYFEPDGHSIKKTLMKTPIDGARLSSGFGMRHHPVLGYDKMHKGVDFAAPTGTPIYAAGDGVVESIGNNGGYGNYIRLRHNSTLKTAYAHMHKYAKSLSKGARVKQGDIIGYVGTTGRSTGPHLHYEVLVNNVQKNPRSVDLPTGEQLKGTELAKFNDVMNSMKNRYASLVGNIKLARAEY